jgi:peptide-methionine (S)-S-oxide reductase
MSFLADLFRDRTRMITPDRALPGRGREMPVPERHFVLGTPLAPPFPDGFQTAVVAMGCFWGAERVFWQAPGVYTTAVGYAGGYTPNPTYEEVCSGSTGHTEAVLVVFDPAQTSYAEMLKLFWENHNPTQGMRQGNDRGTQYRSAIYWDTEEHRLAAEASRAAYNERLREKGYPEITTEIAHSCQRPARHPASPDRAAHESSCCPFYYAEDYHQQYLHKNPWGYCGLGGTGVSCPVGLAVPAQVDVLVSATTQT